MQRNVIILPCIFGPLVADWMINVRGRSGGDGVTGAGQVIYGNQPRWEATLDLSGFGRDRVMAWRAIRARMRGRVNILRVSLCDRWRPTWRELGLPERPAPMPHSDGSFFSDGSGYDYSPTVLSGGAMAGSNQIGLAASPLQPGQWFSHNDWPYQVTNVEDTVYTFEPPLRRAIPAGDYVALEATALMAFMDDMQGQMPLQYGKHGETQIQLIEWTNRP